MGNLAEAMRSRRKVSSNAPAFVPTQPGDPNFSLASTPSSQAQYPAAAAEYRFYQNQRAAGNRLAEAQAIGLDTSGDQYAQLNEAAQTGFTQRAMTLGESLIGWIDGPRQMVNMFIQDMVGGEATEGFENPNFGDYFDAFFSGIGDHDELEERTGLRPISGSETLDMFGWDESTTTWGRIGRGVADFGLQVLTDPLTYLTGGLAGLGRMVGLGAAKKIQKEAVKELVTNGIKQGKSWDELRQLMPDGSYLEELAGRGQSLVDELNFKIQQHAEEFGGALPAEMDEAMAKWLGETGMDAAQENLTELAIAEAVGNDLIKPIARREFAAMNALGRADLPAYGRGGLRISVPFTKSSLEYGVTIPGTVGLGRTLVGEPLRAVSEGLKAFGPYKALANKVNDLGNSLSRNRSLLDAIGKPIEEGGLSSWQYYIAASGFDKMHNSGSRRLILKQLNNRWDDLKGLAAAAGIEDTSIFHAQIMNRLQKANIGGDIMEQIKGHLGVGASLAPDAARFGNTEIDTAIDDIVNYTKATFEEYHNALAVLDPNVKEKFIDGYVPYRTSQGGGELINEIAANGGAIERKLLQKAQSEGNPAYSIAARMISGNGQHPRLSGSMGNTSYLSTNTGVRQQALKLTSDGSVMMDEDMMRESLETLIRNGVIDESALTTRDIPISILNDLLGPVFKDLADEMGIRVPKGWDGNIFNDNPFELLVGYVNSLDEAIGVWDMVNSLQTAGLAFRKETGLQIHETIQSVMASLARRGTKMQTTKAGIPLAGQNHIPTKEAMKIADGTNITEVNTRARSVMLSNGTMGTFDELKEDLTKNGMTRPITIAMADNGEAFIQDGHHRLMAAQELGWDEVPFKVRTETEPFYSTGVNWNEYRKPGFHSGSKAGLDAPDFGTPVDAGEAFTKLPWKPSPVQGNKILKGFDDAFNEAIPMPVLGSLVREGLPASSGRFHEIPELMEIAAMSKDDFMTMTPNVPKVRQAVEPFEKGVRHRMRTVMGADNKVTSLNIELVPDDPDVLLDAVVALDESFKTGALKGQYSPDLVRDLLANPETTEQTAEVLFEYGQAKMLALPDAVKEFFGGEASEIFNMRILYNQWEKGFTDLVQRVAAIETAGGTLAHISGYDTATDEILASLQHLRKGARQLGDMGYDEILKAFKGADVFASMATHRHFIDPGQHGLLGPAVDSLQMHVSMGKYMRNMARDAALLHTPEGIAAAKTAARQSLKWWRAMATIARPTFHARNLIGGSWMNMLHGVGNKEMSTIALNMPTFRKGLGVSRPLGTDIVEAAIQDLPQDARALFRAMWDEDILSGFASTEFRKLTGQEKSGRLNWLKVWDTDNFVLTKLGGQAMQGVEDLLRGSLFARYYDPASPGSSKVARDMVNAIHFDYVNLTPLETKIKSWIPFFVWTKNNIPRQLQMAIENPRTVQKYRAMMQAMTDNFGGSAETLPEGDHFGAYAAGTDIYVNENTPFWARVILDPDLPINDLLALPNLNGPSMIEFAKSLLGPHISILNDVNVQREWGDVNAPQPMAAVLKSLAAVGIYDETTDGDVRIPYYLRSMMETGMPFAKEVLTPLTGGPSDPNRQQRLGIHPEDPEWMQFIKQMGFTALGAAGVKLTTPGDARGVAARSGAQLDDLIQELRLKGEAAPSGG